MEDLIWIDKRALVLLNAVARELAASEYGYGTSHPGPPLALEAIDHGGLRVTWCQEYGIGPRDYDPDCRARLSRIASGVQARVGGRVSAHVSERAACLCVEVRP